GQAEGGTERQRQGPAGSAVERGGGQGQLPAAVAADLHLLERQVARQGRGEGVRAVLHGAGRQALGGSEIRAAAGACLQVRLGPCPEEQERHRVRRHRRGRHHHRGAAQTRSKTVRSRARRLRERAIEAVLFLAALVSVFTTVGIVYILIKESVVFFEQVPIGSFLTDRQWTPLFDNAHFGIMVLLSGTLTSSFVALAIAIPLGTVIAIYLSEFAPFRLREVAKPFLELLGGVPTIVYGYFALLFVTPLLQTIYPVLQGFNLLSAGIVMSIAIIPYASP